MDILVGEVVAAHGLDGGLKVLPFSDHAQAWREHLARVMVDRWDMRAVRVEAVRTAGGLPVLRLEGVASREAASRLVGARLYVRAEDLPPLPAGVFWWHQLVGLSVYLPDGTRLGTVVHVQRAGPHDVLEVEDARGASWLVPFVAAWVAVPEDGQALWLRQDPRDIE
jgi:16S rRNA processing protein RimM